MKELLEEHCRWMETRNYSPGTIRNNRLYVGRFIDWLAERGVTRAEDVTRPMLERYQRVLFHHRRTLANGQPGPPLSFAGQHVRLTTIQGFFKWLCRHHHITANPAADLELPKVEKRLPRAVLTASEAEEILNQPDLATPIGLRDRAVLEILYSTGMRRQELTGLHLYDLDWQRGTVMIRKGKGNKDRLLPLGARAAAWLNKYLQEARPKLVVEPDEREVFLCLSGRGLTPGVLGNLVRGYVRASGVNKAGSCHLFRHAMATLMLENGADLRFIQQMLGHAKLNTTEIYTYVNIQKLIEVHRLTHPAKLPEWTETSSGAACQPPGA
jgi:integrase/recombinase XerD